MARLSSAILASAAFASAVVAQQCAPSQTQCGSDDSLLLYCDGSTWATSRCASDQYCMTMMPGMIHCMLRPEGQKPASSTPTPTSSTSSKPTHANSESDSESDSKTSKSSGAAANKVAAAAFGIVAVAFVALF
ncbi:hypothetical protein H4218_005591 [Coemansia sp. IMI 209128]|nr:hypothetical protein H4218_005591 [Coemansia sp. IMI 209128]